MNRESTMQFELVEQMLAARKQIRPARGGQRISGDKSGSKGTWIVLDGVRPKANDVRPGNKKSRPGLPDGFA
jgi:hypothetical protein